MTTPATASVRSESIADLIITGLVLMGIAAPVLIAIAYATGTTSFLGDKSSPNTLWLVLGGLVAAGGFGTLLTGLHRLLRALEGHLRPRATAPTSAE